MLYIDGSYETKSKKAKQYHQFLSVSCGLPEASAPETCSSFLQMDAYHKLRGFIKNVLPPNGDFILGEFRRNEKHWKRRQREQLRQRSGCTSRWLCLHIFPLKGRHCSSPEEASRIVFPWLLSHVKLAEIACGLHDSQTEYKY